MMNTVVGLFDSSMEAQRAVRALIDGGFKREDIGITSSDYMGDASNAVQTSVANAAENVAEKISEFFRALFGNNDAERSGYYAEAVRRGGTVITVDAETTDQANRAAETLDRNGAVDINQRGAQYRANVNDVGQVTLPVVEEELQVGKREVESGGVRLRSHVVERPVEEVVRLRQERVNVERRPVNRPVSEDYLNAFQDGVIEVTETNEEAVVAKEARVVEEVVVNKEVGEHTKTIRDTVRRSDVEVEQLDADVTMKNVKGASSR